MHFVSNKGDATYKDYVIRCPRIYSIYKKKSNIKTVHFPLSHALTIQSFSVRLSLMIGCVSISITTLFSKSTPHTRGPFRNTCIAMSSKLDLSYNILSYKEVDCFFLAHVYIQNRIKKYTQNIWSGKDRIIHLKYCIYVLYLYIFYTYHYQEQHK